MFKKCFRGYPSPGGFLEVLILKDLEAHHPEVLILQVLLSPVLILMDFKLFIISELRKFGPNAEVLIPERLARSMFANCSPFRRRDRPFRHVGTRKVRSSPTRLRRTSRFGPPRRTGATGSEIGVVRNGKTNGGCLGIRHGATKQRGGVRREPGGGNV
jgi:hypothetical protein